MLWLTFSLHSYIKHLLLIFLFFILFIKQNLAFFEHRLTDHKAIDAEINNWLQWAQKDTKHAYILYLDKLQIAYCINKRWQYNLDQKWCQQPIQIVHEIIFKFLFDTFFLNTIQEIQLAVHHIYVDHFVVFMIQLK